MNVNNCLGRLLLAGMTSLAGMPALAAEPVVLQVITDARSTTVASNRLEAALEGSGCPAKLVFTQSDRSAESASAELVFRISADANESKPLLVAVNADGTAPVPVWVTRKTAGVGSLAELEGRDVSLVAGSDPVAGSLALQALAQHGVTPTRGQRYEAGDFNSALGLLLHNNTHAAASELGLVRPFLDSQGLAINWRGQPVTGAGWYATRPEAVNDGRVQPCLAALSALERSANRQIFRIFPGWVAGFTTPESQLNKDTSQ